MTSTLDNVARPSGAPVKVQLLAYVDRLGGDLPGIARLLTGDGPLAAFGAAHLLPFFVPFDGPDAGFDPIDHASVDPRLGSWADVRALADAGVELTADLIVNHVSSQSTEFTDWLARGAASAWDGMFLTYDRVFPAGAREADITAFYRPRVGLPFTPYQHADGTRRLVWTTFLPTQVDLDVRHPKALAYLEAILRTFAVNGIRTVRLDAVGYAIKTPGTDSFLTPHTLEWVSEITALARSLGLQVLVEVHAHYSQQQAIAPLVDYVYDFAIPALLLHAFGTGDVSRLVRWFEIRPANAITVLDTHDGIGVIDAGPSGERAGLIDHAEMAAIFARAAEATGGQSTEASRRPAWTTVPHQINSTFPAVLGPERYLIARAFQLFSPGVPQLYYAGLLGSANDMERYRRTGEGREVNRHAYDTTELAAALGSPLVRTQLELVQLRSNHPAFDGQFALTTRGGAVLELAWTNGPHRAALTVDLDPVAPSYRVDVT